MKTTNQILHLKTILYVLLLFFISCRTNQKKSILEAIIVEVPSTSQKNNHYISNRAPLQPSVLIKLPVGSIDPDGWLKEYLHRQRSGLTGNLGKISAWLQKENNAWLDKDGKGNWGWEEVPYWLKGYANIGYILDDPEMIKEAKIWIDGAINSQKPNGFFGPRFAWESYISEENEKLPGHINRRRD